MGDVMRAVAPAAKIVAGAPPRRMSSCSTEVKRYIQDPLNTPGMMPVETAQSTALAFDEIKASKESMVYPVLGIHGGKDAVLVHAATERLVNASKSSDKKYVFLPDMWHTTLHEPEWRGVYDTIEKWIGERSREIQVGAPEGKEGVDVKGVEETDEREGVDGDVGDDGNAGTNKAGGGVDVAGKKTEDERNAKTEN
jgi:hypothetical protein